MFTVATLNHLRLQVPISRLTCKVKERGWVWKLSVQQAPFRAQNNISLLGLSPNSNLAYTGPKPFHISYYWAEAFTVNGMARRPISISHVMSMDVCKPISISHEIPMNVCKPIWGDYSTHHPLLSTRTNQHTMWGITQPTQPTHHWQHSCFII